jgi:hypothetical protein
VTGTSPAPWVVNSSGGAITIVSRDRSVLAVIVGGGDAAPFEAGNAALMGAAPALRDELETLLERLTDGRREISESTIEEWAGEIRAALAKTEAGR